MRGTRVALFVHLIWTTWDRLPLLTGERERRVHRCIEDTCHDLGVEVIAIGGIEDHIHLLVRMPATLSVADLVKRLKGASSHLATHEVAPDDFFKWQGGYAAFSTSLALLNKVSDYVRHQKEHHRTGALVAAYEPDPHPEPPHP
jgi:putative transposase